MIKMNTQIISIQSQVSYGYVGNNIAGLAIQLHRLNPLMIPTVVLSNPFDYKHTYGSPVNPSLFGDLLKGILLNRFIDQCDYLISGYCNSKDIISQIADFVQDLKSYKNCTYVYDPVYGDIRSGGLYVSKDVADYSISKLLPLSDIITPNCFEIEYILAEKIETADQLLRAVCRHAILKNKTVIATSMRFQDTPVNTIEVALIKDNKIMRFASPCLPVEVVGAGDLFTAIVASQLNRSQDVIQAIEKGLNYLHYVLLDMLELGYKEFNSNLLFKHVNLLL